MDVIPIRKLHSEMTNVGRLSTLDASITRICELYDIDGNISIGRELVSEKKRLFKNETGENVKKGSRTNIDLAEWITERLFQCMDMEKITTLHDLLLEGAKIYHKISKYWGPILTSFVETVSSICNIRGIERIHFLARDSNPAFITANRSKAKGGIRQGICLSELSRPMLGIHDEIARGRPSKTRGFPSVANIADPIRCKIIRYLSDLFEDDAKSACLDIECYGTLFCMIFELNLYPTIFLFASNSHDFWGFVNGLIHHAHYYGDELIPYPFIWTLGDTIESFPKLYKNTRFSADKTGNSLVAEPVDIFYASCAMSIYWTLNGDFSHDGPYGEIKKLYELQARVKEGKEKLPIILPEATQAWSQRRHFLNEFHKKYGPKLPFNDIDYFEKR